MIIKKRKK